MPRRFVEITVTRKRAGYEDALSLVNSADMEDTSTDFDIRSIEGAYKRELPLKYKVRYTVDPKGEVNVILHGSYCEFVNDTNFHWNACFLEKLHLKANTRMHRTMRKIS